MTEKLLNEFDRRVVDEVLFCSSDERGKLVTPSDVPINNIFLKFTFDFMDAANQVIREVGVMVGAKQKENLPPGQRYLNQKTLKILRFCWYLNTRYH